MVCKVYMVLRTILKLSILSNPLLPNAVITAPGMDTLKVPLVAERATLDNVSVWEWSGSAYDEGAAAAEWFSAYFGKPSRLVRFKEGVYLVVFLNCKKAVFTISFTTGGR